MQVIFDSPWSLNRLGLPPKEDDLASAMSTWVVCDLLVNDLKRKNEFVDKHLQMIKEMGKAAQKKAKKSAVGKGLQIILRGFSKN